MGVGNADQPNLDLQRLADEQGLFHPVSFRRWTENNSIEEVLNSPMFVVSIQWSTAIGRPRDSPMWEAFALRVERLIGQDEQIPGDWTEDLVDWHGVDSSTADRYGVLFGGSYHFPVENHQVSVSLEDQAVWQEEPPFAFSSARPVVGPPIQRLAKAPGGVLHMFEFTLVAPIHIELHPSAIV